MHNVDDVNPAVPPSGPGCVECELSGGWWLHLRRCASCGHVGCCDSSPSKHATSHWQLTGHAVVQSYEPGESWFWDYRSAAGFEGPELAAPVSHPLQQPVPGPADRLPPDILAELG